MDLHLPDDAGAHCVTITRLALGDRQYALPHRWAPDSTGVPEVGAWTDALRTALDAARAAGARVVTTRVVTREEGVPATLAAARAERFRAVLRSLGFRHVEGRVEFRLALEAPAVGAWLRARASADPLRWDALAPSGGVPLERAARVLHRAAQGDPATNPDEDAAAFLQAALADPALTGAPSCVQIGGLDTPAGREDAAFVMAQVDPATGWGRVTYLGVIPERRGRGLGPFVHARGLAMLRVQGATRYQGGTSTRNAPMLALFRALGAEGFRALEEWSLAT